MARPYFRQVPNFEYVSRLTGSKNISDYVPVKNLFKRAKLRPDIEGNLAYFQNYTIIGDERPDNVAYKFYDDSTLDWLILLSNNIVNIQTEWPLPQRAFDEYLLEKYRTQDAYIKYFKLLGANVSPSEVPVISEEEAYHILYNGIHHYETKEVRNNSGTIIVPAGIRVPKDYKVSFFDYNLDRYVDVLNVAQEVTNYQYEEELQNNKRTILVLKSEYLRLVFDDIERLMPYKKGSSQYVTETLKRGQNIRLYE